MINNSKRAAGYIRVSTEEQTERFMPKAYLWYGGGSDLTCLKNPASVKMNPAPYIPIGSAKTLIRNGRGFNRTKAGKFVSHPTDGRKPPTKPILKGITEVSQGVFIERERWEDR